ncbi:MAG: BrnT family toxin [Candidatus Levybacteria bacterium]|nr:BrnT family toxin [Candidatus Levybacteria bacterium]
MKYVDWDEEKNKKLKKERGVSFEEVLIFIQKEKVLEVIDQPNQKRYLNQKIFIVIIDNYVYMVPFKEDTEKFFLKTIIPSRKMTKKYIKKGGENI